MYKLIIAAMLLGSCAIPKPKSRPDPVHRYKTMQEKVLDCYGLLKRMGESGKQAGEICMRLFKED